MYIYYVYIHIIYIVVCMYLYVITTIFQFNVSVILILNFSETFLSVSRLLCNFFLLTNNSLTAFPYLHDL